MAKPPYSGGVSYTIQPPVVTFRQPGASPFEEPTKPMLTATPTLTEPHVPSSQPSATVYLVRYGVVPEVARFRDASQASPSRGETVVVETHRGLQVGSVLERLKPSLVAADMEIDFEIIRVATPADLEAARARTRECDAEFAGWCARILEWELQLELVDLEWTLDRQKLILYVLCERGPDSTKLALQAAATGFGVIEVQPVAATGLVSLPKESGGCGTGGGGYDCSH